MLHSVETVIVYMREKANKYLPSNTPPPQKLTHKSENRNAANVFLFDGSCKTYLNSEWRVGEF